MAYDCTVQMIENKEYTNALDWNKSNKEITIMHENLVYTKDALCRNSFLYQFLLLYKIGPCILQNRVHFFWKSEKHNL